MCKVALQLERLLRIDSMRVLSLLPGATEIICALGAGDSLVGVTHECDFPRAVVDRVPRVTRSTIGTHVTAPGEIDNAVRERSNTGQPLYVLDEAAIVELAPDLIVTQALCDVCAVSETDVRAIAQRMANRPNVATLDGTTWGGVAEDIRSVGAALGCSHVAETLVESLAARLRVVHDRLHSARAPRPRVVVIEWTDPIFAAGHWVPELVRRAGGREMMAAAGEHSVVRTVDEIRNSDPELLVVAPCGYDVGRAVVAARELLATDQWNWAAEVPVWAVDANSLLSRPGPRLVDGTETLAAIMHPALFGAPAQSRARRVR
jgi:iron complex transport system substrate-binding protein